MDKKFLDLRPMRLVGRRGQIELHRPDNSPAEAREEHAAASGVDGRQNLILPECLRVVARERQNETDARAGVNTRV